MDAIKLLERQHREVEKLFEKFENSDDDKVKLSTFEHIADVLAVHMEIEEKHFYPACRAKGTKDEVAEAYDEHKEVKRLVVHAMSSTQNPGFDGLVAAIKGGLHHHIHEEENQLFPKAKKLLDKDTLDDIGDKMNTMGEDLKQKGNARKLLTPARAKAPA